MLTLKRLGVVFVVLGLILSFTSPVATKGVETAENLEEKEEKECMGPGDCYHP